MPYLDLKFYGAYIYPMHVHNLISYPILLYIRYLTEVCHTIFLVRLKSISPHHLCGYLHIISVVDIYCMTKAVAQIGWPSRMRHEDNR